LAKIAENSDHSIDPCFKNYCINEEKYKMSKCSLNIGINNIVPTLFRFFHLRGGHLRQGHDQNTRDELQHGGDGA
jgi:hypothetical protein